MRVIFTVPTTIHRQYPDPLVYVEWFSEFSQSPEEHLRLWKVTRSANAVERQTEVIKLGDIIQTCHLIPVFGKKKSNEWKRDNVLEKCEEFYLNSFLDIHSYCSM